VRNIDEINSGRGWIEIKGVRNIDEINSGAGYR